MKSPYYERIKKNERPFITSLNRWTILPDSVYWRRHDTYPMDIYSMSWYGGMTDSKNNIYVIGSIRLLPQYEYGPTRSRRFIQCFNERGERPVEQPWYLSEIWEGEYSNQILLLSESTGKIFVVYSIKNSNSYSIWLTCHNLTDGKKDPNWNSGISKLVTETTYLNFSADVDHDGDIWIGWDHERTANRFEIGIAKFSGNTSTQLISNIYIGYPDLDNSLGCLIASKVENKLFLVATEGNSDSPGAMTISTWDLNFQRINFFRSSISINIGSLVGYDISWNRIIPKAGYAKDNGDIVIGGYAYKGTFNGYGQCFPGIVSYNTNLVEHPIYIATSEDGLNGWDRRGCIVKPGPKGCTLFSLMPWLGDEGGDVLIVKDNDFKKQHFYPWDDSDPDESSSIIELNRFRTISGLAYNPKNYCLILTGPIDCSTGLTLCYNPKIEYLDHIGDVWPLDFIHLQLIGEMLRGKYPSWPDIENVSGAMESTYLCHYKSLPAKNLTPKVTSADIEFLISAYNSEGNPKENKNLLNQLKSLWKKHNLENVESIDDLSEKKVFLDFIIKTLLKLSEIELTPFLQKSITIRSKRIDKPEWQLLGLCSIAGSELINSRMVNAELKIISPFYNSEYLPCFPFCEFILKSDKDTKEYDIAISLWSFKIPGGITQARIIKLDKKKWIDVTTGVCLTNRVVTGRVNELGHFILMAKKASATSNDLKQKMNL